MPLERISASVTCRFFRLALGGLIAVLAVGCQKEGEVTNYTVPRENTERPALPAERPPAAQPATAAPAAPGAPERMLAAMIEQKGTVWFFKLLGPAEAVTKQADTFRKFIQSAHLKEDGTPEWKLPEGWQQKPASGMRFATLEVPGGEKPLELTVTPLKMNENDFEAYVLANANRWRDQLSLPPTTKAQLFDPTSGSGELTEVKLPDGQKAQLVDLTGTGSSGSQGMMAGMGGMGATMGGGPPHAPVEPAGGAPAVGAPQLTYETPKGWAPGKVDTMRQAAFDIQDGDKKAEMTVIALGAAGGDLLANVNRWRQQINLQPIDRAELDKQRKEIDVAGAKGSEVELLAPADAKPREGILGVICVNGDKAWFFKLKGDADLVEREKPQFEAFVRSVKFTGPDGAAHVQ